MSLDQCLASAFVNPASVLSVAELHEAGLGKAALATLVRTGRITRVTSGFYALPSDVTSSARLLRLARALERRLGPSVVLSHHAALVARDLPLYERELPMHTAHLTYRKKGCGRTRSDHVLHRAPAGDAVPETGDLPVAIALLQTGSLWGERPFVVAADAAVRAGMTTPALLTAALHRRPSHPAHARLARAVSRVDGRSESPGESLLRLRLLDMGYSVEPQVKVLTDGGAYRLDLALTDTRVAIEFDGLGKYDSRPDARRAEKRREEDLRTADWEVVRFQWTDLDNVATIKKRVEWAEHRARPRDATAEPTHLRSGRPT